MSAATSEKQLEYLLSFYDRFAAWKAQKEEELSKVDPKLLALYQCLDAQFAPFVHHVVKMKTPAGATEREAFAARAKAAIDAGLNSFYMPAELLELDFLSDSGSSAMTTHQWGKLLDGDESYGSNEGWPIFNRTMAEVFGPKFGNPFLGASPCPQKNEAYKFRKNFNYLVNQGRGAENALYPALAECLVKRDTERLAGMDSVTYYCLCSNNFFDTTAGHVLDIHDHAVRDLNGREVHVTFKLVNHPNLKIKNGTYSDKDRYLGDGDFEGLKTLMESVPEWQIGIVVTTITNNSGGSQPVSLDHIRKVSELCRKHNVLYMMDACRFAENCYMIQQLEREAGEAGDKELAAASVQEIVHKLFTYVDGFTISLKKDGLANCGGALCFDACSKALAPLIDQKGFCMLQMIYDSVILNVGHFTYGAITGRDIKAICEGLHTIVQEHYLAGRIGQVQRFAKILKSLGVPILEPCGTSAVYLDMDRFFDDTGAEKKFRGKYYGNSLVGIMLCTGVRLCELGASAFSSPYGNAPYAKPEDVSGNFVRIAIPRQLYSDTDLYKAAMWLCFLYENRQHIKGVIDRPNLRKLSLHHFKMMFDFEE